MIDNKIRTLLNAASLRHNEKLYYISDNIKVRYSEDNSQACGKTEIVSSLSIKTTFLPIFLHALIVKNHEHSVRCICI